MAGAAAPAPRNVSPPRPKKKFPAFSVHKERTGDDVWPPSPTAMENYRKYFYPPKHGGNPTRPMTKKVVCVDQQRNAEDFFALRDWAKRLGHYFNSLAKLNKYIMGEFDPCRSGFIGLGDFLCLWFKRKALTARRPYVQQLGIMGVDTPATPQSQHVVMVAAVAAAMGANTLRRDMEKCAGCSHFNERHQFEPSSDDREARDTAKQLEKEGIWFGGWSWRKPPPLPEPKPPPKEEESDPVLRKLKQDQDAERHALDGQQIYFTPFLLYKIRQYFEKYDENDCANPGDATAHIRFGMVASFLHEIRRDPDLGPFFALRDPELHKFLNDLVRHANDGMRDLREQALERRQRVLETKGGPDESASESDVDWDPSEDEVLAGMLERARTSLKYRRPRQAERELQDLMRHFKNRENQYQPPPYFEEPAFNFCNVLALLVKYMVTDKQGDEVLEFFNQGIALFHTLIGKQEHGNPTGANTPRVLPVRVLLREFSHLELSHPNSTAFVDAAWPCFAGPMGGAWQPHSEKVPVRRKMPANEELTISGAM